MSANRSKGTRLERAVADYLAAALSDDRVDRMPLHGKGDRGDIAGVRTGLGERVVVEVKNHARLNLAGWAAEVAAEKGNADATVGVVVHKRHGKGQPADQWVTMTLADFATLLGGTACAPQPPEREPSMSGPRIVATCEACDLTIDVPDGPLGEFFRQDFESFHSRHADRSTT